jgi:lipid-binding SYLF domain-containing protein
MNIRRLIASLILVLFTLAGCQMPGGKADPAAAAQIDGAVDQALRNLYSSTPAARALAKRAKGILVFPGVVKAGFIVGGQFGGKGALRENGRTVGYYNIVAGSYGLQAGVQTFDYAMFFMDKAALDYLKTSQGFEVGVGPSVVLVDEGMAKTLTTTTAQDDVYAFVFGQKGLMAGLGVQGSKITQINP